MLLSSLMPWPYRAMVIAALAAALFGFGWIKGASHEQAKSDAAKAAQTVFVAHVQQKQAEATVQVVTKYVDRIRTVHETGATITKEIPIYVPSDAVDLPGGFRLLHDAAALGKLPDSSRIANAASVPVADIARTVTANYETYHSIAEQLTALQEWIKAQQIASSPQ